MLSPLDRVRYFRVFLRYDPINKASYVIAISSGLISTFAALSLLFLVVHFLAATAFDSFVHRLADMSLAALTGQLHLPLSFGEAMTEVEEILADLEREDVDIDRLSGQVKRAVELITICREKLQKTDREVSELVAGLQDDAAGAEDVTP